MTTMQTGKSQTIGISISESPDLASFGLSDGHIRDAMVNIAMYLLAAGDDLAYGGDLRTGGFTQTLFELVQRYTKNPLGSNQRSTTAAIGNEPARVANYLAWPVHAGMTGSDIESLAGEIRDFATIILLDLDGRPISMDDRKTLTPVETNETEWTTGLTHMRKTMRECINARILLGGRTEGYKGRMPGVAEEALLSMEAGQPVFLLGGFGGATRDIAEVLHLAPSWEGSREQWAGRSEFTGFGAESLHNNLSHEENKVLATTPYIDRSLPLLLRGLRRLRNGANNPVECV